MAAFVCHGSSGLAEGLYLTGHGMTGALWKAGLVKFWLYKDITKRE